MSEKINTFQFDGEGWELFKLYVSNLLLTLVTFGIYYFWAKVKVKKYLYNHTSLLSGRFDYHVTGKEKLIAFIKGIFIFGIPFFGIFGGLPFLLRLLGFSETIIAITTPLVFYVIFIGVLPLLIYGSKKFQLARTSWNSIHFRFYGKVKPLYKIILKGIFLSIITLGIYNAWFIVELKKYMDENSALGNQKFTYEGKGVDVFKIFLKALFLIPLTLGFYLFWFSSEIQRYHWSRTKFKEYPFTSTISGAGLLKVTAVNTLITLCTLGFGMPWALVNIQKYVIETLHVKGDINLSDVEASIDLSADALAEGISEAGDLLDTFGDFVG